MPASVEESDFVPAAPARQPVVSMPRVALAGLAAAIWALPAAALRGSWYGFDVVRLALFILGGVVVVFVVLMPLVSVAAGFVEIRSERRAAGSLCQRCAYPVRDVPLGAPCPECGAKVDPTPREAIRRFAAVTLVAVVCGVTAACAGAEVYRLAEEASFATEVRRQSPARPTSRNRWFPAGSALRYDPEGGRTYVTPD